LAWSPDGRYIAEIESQTEGVFGVIRLLDVLSRKSHILAKFKDLGISEAMWAPDGRGLITAFREKSYRREQVGFVSNPNGQFHPITKDTNTYQSLTLSSDGKTLAAVQQKPVSTLHILPAAGLKGSESSPALSQVKHPSNFSWANDGGLYISDLANLIRISADGSNKTTILSDPNASIFETRDCSGGRYVVVTWGGHGGNHVNIWRANADGSNQKQLSEGNLDSNPTCSPDGKWVYYTDFEARQMMRVQTEGGKPEPAPGTGMPEIMIGPGALSPDGKMLVFFVKKAAATLIDKKIALVSLDPGANPKVRILDCDPRAVSLPEFTRDGKAVVYPIRSNGADNLWLQALDGTRGRQITNFFSDSIVHFEFSPDGKDLGVLRAHDESDVVLLSDSGPSAQ
jgi:Tol biopolymer transport system component